MKKYTFLFMAVILVVISCVIGYLPAHAQEAGKKNPIWCTPPAAPGDTKDKIKTNWGDPDIVKDLGKDETGLRKEEWVYSSKPFTFLSKNEYVCATQHLVFIGNNLVKIFSSEDEVRKEYGPKQ